MNKTTVEKCIKPLALSVLALGLALPLRAEKKTVDFELSGEYRVRAEGRYDLDLNKDADDERSPILQRVRLGAKATLNPNLSAFVQIQDSRSWGDEASTSSNEYNVDLHQGWVRLAGGEGFDLTLGRQEWSYGDQRLIGAFGWDNVGRAFDGARARKDWETAWLDLLWGRVARIAEEGENEKEQDLLGAYLHFDVNEHTGVEPYVLAFRSGVEVPGERGDAAGTSRVVALGGRVAWSPDPASLTAEGVYETGQVGPDDLSAFALGITASYRFGTDSLWFKPTAGFDYASGDEDRGDGKRGEFFNFFPTNHVQYGYLDLFGWRNLLSPWGGVGFGGNGHNVLVKLHHFSLAEEAGRWSSAGGATLGFDPAGASGSAVGNEIDLTYKRTFYEAFDLLAGFSHFMPGDFAKATRGDDPASFWYLEGHVRF